MAAAETDEEFPSELTEKLANFHTQLGAVKAIIENVVNVNHETLHQKMTPVDRAMFDLVMSYALNSLYWMYLNTKGENPKENTVKKELDRIRSYMNKVKEIVDREKAPRIDAEAAQRFVRGALWSAKKKDMRKENGEEENDEAEIIEEIKKEVKRKNETESIEENSKKKKKRKNKVQTQ